MDQRHACALLPHRPARRGRASPSRRRRGRSCTTRQPSWPSRGGTDYGYYIPQWDQALPAVFTWQAGGAITDADGKVTFDSDAFRTAADFYLSFYADGLVPTASDFDQTIGFISGAAPMLISGPYLAKAISDTAPELDGKWGVAPLPKGDAAGTSLFAGSNLAVWNGTDAMDQSLALLDFLAEPATQVAVVRATQPAADGGGGARRPGDRRRPDGRGVRRAARRRPACCRWSRSGTRSPRNCSRRSTASALNGDDEASTLDRLNDADRRAAAVTHGRAPRFRRPVGRRRRSGVAAGRRSRRPTPSSDRRSCVLFVFGIAADRRRRRRQPHRHGHQRARRTSATSSFIGFDNYSRLFRDTDFWRALRNTAIFVGIGVPAIVVHLDGAGDRPRPEHVALLPCAAVLLLPALDHRDRRHLADLGLPLQQPVRAAEQPPRTAWASTRCRGSPTRRPPSCRWPVVGVWRAIGLNTIDLPRRAPGHPAGVLRGVGARRRGPRGARRSRSRSRSCGSRSSS